MGNIQLWKSDSVVMIPSDIYKIEDIVTYSNDLFLSKKQQEDIINAFNNKSYDMVTEYVWKKAITRLREHIQQLGDDFLSEMVHISEQSNRYYSVSDSLTDFNLINLSEQLGMITHTGAFELRQAYETIQYYFSSLALQEKTSLDSSRVVTIIKTCVAYILSQPNMQVAVDFKNFRNRLLNEDLSSKDEQISQLMSSSLFFKRTVCTILQSAIRKHEGATLEHVLHNFKIILSFIWSSLSREDWWNIGSLYRDMVTDGNRKAALGVKAALLQVRGFDYVPESTRSDSFKEVANVLINIHFGFDNFYKEKKAVEELASLGTVIPDPALPVCIKAFLLVYIGNFYGRSIAATPIAQKQLEKLTPEQWSMFFDYVLPYDMELLEALSSSSRKPFHNFHVLIGNIYPLSLETQPGKLLYSSIKDDFFENVKKYYKSIDVS